MADEPIWNTRVTVIDLIPAPDGDEAISRLSAALDAAGFQVHVDTDMQDAFESEHSDETDVQARAEWLGGRFHPACWPSSAYVLPQRSRRW